MAKDNAPPCPPPVTRWLADRASGIDFADLPEAAVTVTRHCILDWFAVTLPGAVEPTAQILRDELLEDGALPVASLVGFPGRTSAAHAAIINGTASHALDFDDVNMAVLGHPTVAILPGLLALAEQIDATDEDLIAAFVAGYEVACRAGALVSPSHYNHGFHATATVGSIGAAAGCARLLGLDGERTATAMSIAATLASGLKSMFGTMCKPLHAGRASQNGLMAARLAARGYSGRTDALECTQGFAATQSVDFHPDAAMAPAPLDHHLRQNLFKYHAACYLTHGAIEAAGRLRRDHAISPNAIEAITIRVPPMADRVCNLPRPQTGLEAKFSLRLTVAMALAGRDTSGIGTYTDDLTRDPVLVQLRDLAVLEFDDIFPEAKARISISAMGGQVLTAEHDAGVPGADLAEQERKLAAKFEALVVPVLGSDRADSLRDAILALGHGGSVRELMKRAEVLQ